MVGLNASDLAARLAGQAEAVCRHYLGNGRRQGNYWLVGDVRNTPGRSLFVRLTGPLSGKGASGHWRDSATAEHGDLLDVIRLSLGLVDFADVAEEARRFLALPRAVPKRPGARVHIPAAPMGSSEAARRLFAMARSIQGTLAETYLRQRGIQALHGTGNLRFHPRCFYRTDDHGPPETWPALIAAVTDLGGAITGVHRTWLDPAGFSDARLGKAPIDTPRRAMGELLGHAARFGLSGEVLAVGEGLESVLSVRQAIPRLAMAAALSAGHLAAFRFPPALSRLYLIRDADPAGDAAMAMLTQRAQGAGIEALILSPRQGDFNEDLRLLGIAALQAAIRVQLAPQDVARFMDLAA
jgi:hypothetical protein